MQLCTPSAVQIVSVADFHPTKNQRRRKDLKKDFKEMESDSCSKDGVLLLF